MANESDNLLPQRHNPSRGVHINIGCSNLVLLNVNTKDRKPWLADPTVHKLIHEVWQEAAAWLVSDYLLMPDHLHCFCAPRDLHFDIETWIRYWKRELTKRQKNLNGPLATASWKFQTRGWHHRIRDGQSYSEKWIYVQENPLRKGLCKRIEDWPYKGRVYDFIWTGD